MRVDKYKSEVRTIEVKDSCETLAVQDLEKCMLHLDELLRLNPTHKKRRSRVEAQPDRGHKQRELPDPRQEAREGALPHHQGAERRPELPEAADAAGPRDSSQAFFHSVRKMVMSPA